MTRLQRLRTLATVAYDPEDDVDPDEALMATGCSPAPAVQNTPKAGGLDVPEDVPEVICEDVKENEASTSPVPPGGSIRSDPLRNSIFTFISLWSWKFWFCSFTLQLASAAVWRKVLLVLFMIFELGPYLESLWKGLTCEPIRYGVKEFFHPKN